MFDVHKMIIDGFSKFKTHAKDTMFFKRSRSACRFSFVSAFLRLVRNTLVPFRTWDQNFSGLDKRLSLLEAGKVSIVSSLVLSPFPVSFVTICFARGTVGDGKPANPVLES